MLLAGVALLSVGLLFKMGAVPFQAWKPDVYQGAPTAITALMASCTLVSAVGGILRVFYVGFETLRWDWRPMMWAVAILTMLLGAIVAITQTDVKRMLAYSSIAHGGFLLTGVIATNEAGLSATLFYLAAYGFTTVGAFAVITMVRDAGGEAWHLSRWAGLGKRAAAAGRHVRAVPARLRRYPADQRVHRKVRGLPGRDRGRRDYRWSSWVCCPRRSPRSSTYA